MSKALLYHNPRWGKSREAVKLLNSNNTDFDVVEYLKDPLSENEILVLAKKLGKRPKDFIRTSEKDFKDNNIKSLINNDRALAKAMEGLPKIMERPIFVVGENAVIGRPPENILTLLDKKTVLWKTFYF